ncbi:MAG: hypothetical protein PHR61_00815 [Candidatus Absconditabacteria bacterium]|nr:hypothetical protein [Candidatus Absconditabacteria bacterium]
MIKTLAIETSCDDTSIGIISFDGDRFEVEKLLAYSQVADHQKYGGVMPEIASRLHSEKIIGVLDAVGWGNIENIDNISVTTHPGLPGSLVVGKAVGATLASWYDKSLYEVNHIHGHIFSLFLERKISEFEFPMVVLTASGGHNDLYLVSLDSRPNGQSRNDNEEIQIDQQKFAMDCHPIRSTQGRNDLEKHTRFHIEHLGKTLDDAAGECFDKVSRMLGGPYPGGVWIGEMALKHKKHLEEFGFCNKCEPVSSGISFKRIFLAKESFDFSFSGMKSQVSILLKQLEERKVTLTEDLICEIAYEFQEAVVEVLAKKLLRAGAKYEAKTLGISGGVSANDRLWEYGNGLIKHKNYKSLNFNLVKPTKKVYSTDNAAMIGVAGILQQQQML